MSVSLKWFTRTMAAVMLVTVALACALTTTVGQRLLIAAALSASATEDQRIQIGTLEGSVFSNGHIDQISIGDRNGVWLEIQNTRFSWNAFALIAGRIEIAELAVEKIDVSRSPAPTRQDDEKTEAFEFPSIAIAANRLHVAEIVLGEALLGTPARFRLDSSADIVDQRRGLSAKLSIIRTDSPGGEIYANLTFQPVGKQLEIVGSVREPAGGLVARLLDLPGLPPLAFTAEGRGPLDKWRAHWSLSASSQPFVAGTASIDRRGEQHVLKTRMEGYLSQILPPVLRSIFDGKTVASVDGYWNNAGRFEAESISVKNDAVELVANAGIDTTRAYVHGGAEIRLERANGARLLLHLNDGNNIAFSGLEATLDLPNTHGPRRIMTEVTVSNVETPWGKLGRAGLNAHAEQAQSVGRPEFTLDAAAIHVGLREIMPLDKRVFSAVGPSIDVQMQGHGSLGSAVIESFVAQTAGVRTAGNGRWADGAANLTAKVDVGNLDRYSELAGRKLTGSATWNVTATLPSGAAPSTLSVDGSVTDLGVGDPVATLNGDTKFIGSIHRTSTGNWVLKEANVSHPKLTFQANGKYGRDGISGKVDGKLGKLSLLSPSLRGALLVKGNVHESGGVLNSSISLSGLNVTINGNPASNLTATYDGAGPWNDHQGRFSLGGTIDGNNINGAGQVLVSEDGAFSLEGLKLAYSSAKLAGSIRKSNRGPISGRLQLTAPNLAEFAALSEGAIAGSVSAWAELGGTSDQPQLRFSAKSERAEFSGIRITAFDASGQLSDYDRAIKGQANVRVGKIEQDGFVAQTLHADVGEADEGLRFRVSGLVNEAEAQLAGQLIQQGATYRIHLADTRLAKSGTMIRLDGPGEIELQNGTLGFKKFALLSSRGRASISGTAGPEALALKIALSQMPAAVANIVRSDLGFGGAMNGTIDARGTIADPVASVAIDWRNATAAVMRDAQLPPLSISLRGNLQDGKFDNRLTVRGPGDLDVSVHGEVHLTRASEIMQRVTGNIPLALGNAQLAARGTQFGGNATLNVAVSGNPASPKLSGTAMVAGGSMNDPTSGLKITRLNGRMRLAGDRVVIDQLGGNSEKGGAVSVTGIVAGLSTGQLETQIALRLAGVKFNDNAMLAGEIDGDLALNGPVTSPRASGYVYIKRLDVTVPSKVPRSVSALQLRHINAPPHLQSATPENKHPTVPQSETNGIGLDLTVEAADRIFVRGRGLDAQLGGGLKVSGTSKAPATSGSFDLLRGRLAILGRQFDFKHGKISFIGSLEPYIELEATAPADDVTAQINVSGPLSRLTFRFSSIPDLPEDEVVAKLLFNKSLANLSPLQLAQLANEINKIGGLTSGPGILDQLKKSVGVDVLDFGTDKAGGATVSAGSYLNDQTYVGVQQGTTAGSSRVVIDHDLTKNLKARGEVGADGNSKIGIGVEWDY